MRFGILAGPWIIIAWSVLVCFHAPAADWPQWRGPFRTGYAAPEEHVVETLPSEPKVLWKLAVGEGLASPVVASGKLVYFDGLAGNETLHALDLSSRQELWRQPVDDTFADTQGPAGPRCTPVIDDDRVYAVSCRGELQCLELTSGKRIWRANYTKDFDAVFIGEKGNATGATRHGNNGSPLIVGEHLIACVGSTNGASVVCFEKHTGQVLWKAQNDPAGYAPPILATIGGSKQVICFMADALLALNPDDGALLWTVPMKTSLGRHVTTPLVVDDIVVVGSHQIGLIGTKVLRTSSGWKTEQAWVNKDLAMNFSSPVVVGKYLFGLGKTRNLFCLDVPAGHLEWSKPGYFTTAAEKAYASFLVLGKNILTLTDGGELVLFAADPAAFKELGRAQICGLNWCNPALSDGKLYVRDGIKGTGNLLCVQLVP